MKHTMRLSVGALLLSLALVWGAAPPPAKPVRLTATQLTHVNGLSSHAHRAAVAGEFEAAAKWFRQAAEYRAKHQGARNWEALDAKWRAEEFRLLTKVPAKD